MKVNTSQLDVQKKFFEFYDDVEIVPFADAVFDSTRGAGNSSGTASGFMAFKRKELYLSMDSSGNWQPDVVVPGNNEKFIIHGDILIHVVSGSAVPCYNDRIPTLPTS
jgi:hypothetical protein